MRTSGGVIKKTLFLQEYTHSLTHTHRSAWTHITSSDITVMLFLCEFNIKLAGENRKDRKEHWEVKKKHKTKGTQGAQSNLSFIQLANEVREPGADRGLIEGKNFSQQATLTQDFYSCLSLILSVFSFFQRRILAGERREETVRMTLSSCSVSWEE